MEVQYIPQVPQAVEFTLDRFVDDRGAFQEVWQRGNRIPGFGPSQINYSTSHENVVRGIHIAPHGKLCTCLNGSLFDVVVDMRPGPSFLNWYGVWLTGDNNKQLYIPPHCGHAFFAAEDNTILLYAQNGTYVPELEAEVHWRSSKIGIEWPEAKEYIVSEKDKNARKLEDAD